MTHRFCVQCYDEVDPDGSARALVGDPGTRCCACGLGPARIPYADTVRTYPYCRFVHGDQAGVDPR